MPPLSEVQVETALPNTLYSSDHLAVVCDLQFRNFPVPPRPCPAGARCRSQTCDMTHPVPCPAGMNCCEKDCAALHLAPCKYGITCSNTGCQFSHLPCRNGMYGTQCADAACPYSHLVRCRYGNSCTRSECHYYHPSRPLPGAKPVSSNSSPRPVPAPVPAHPSPSHRVGTLSPESLKHTSPQTTGRYFPHQSSHVISQHQPLPLPLPHVAMAAFQSPVRALGFSTPAPHTPPVSHHPSFAPQPVPSTVMFAGPAPNAPSVLPVTAITNTFCTGSIPYPCRTMPTGSFMYHQ